MAEPNGEGITTAADDLPRQVPRPDAEERVPRPDAQERVPRPDAEERVPRPDAEEAARPEDEKLAEVRERAQRAIADADNARKRAERTCAERVAAERQRVASAWLPVLDNLDLALRHAGADPDAIVQGVAQVRDQAADVLARLGFGPIGAVGEPFDPARHEAAEAVAEPGLPAGTVARVIRLGYGGDTLLLRPAIVAVASAGSGGGGPGADTDRQSDGG
ncbi:nucleotide exchange factor GrpE [Dactylosporangium sp. CA-139114]|uniref:nucleotide exchange factor GrpE n=1 Tax=Dactylosporangium sp. CA-139114 TaxID=3239931 RepID=UPI003D95145D